MVIIRMKHTGPEFRKDHTLESLSTCLQAKSEEHHIHVGLIPCSEFRRLQTVNIPQSHQKLAGCGVDCGYLRNECYVI